MKKMYLFSYPKCLLKLKTCCAYVECTFPVNLHLCISSVHEFSINLEKKFKKKQTCCAYVECTFPVNLHLCISSVHEFSINL